MSRRDSRVTRILRELSEGDPYASARLLPVVYDELRRLAHIRMRDEPAGLTLQPTALVHEAYLRLVADDDVRWENRRHFFAAAAEAMRRILVKHARKYSRQKHGGGRRRVDLDDVERAGLEQGSDDLIALDEALRKLEEKDPLRSTVVKLRHFAGLTISQTADVMGIAPATVKRYWSFAQAWLCREIVQARTGATRIT